MNNVERWRVKVEGTILRGLKDGATTKNIAECIVESILEEAISAVKNDTECKGKWISIDERLPEKSGAYLVHTTSGHISNLDYSARHKLFNTFDSFSTDTALTLSMGVTHWMPLPEAPKMKGGAE